MIDWNISPESSSLSCLLGWNPSLFSFNYYCKLLTMIDWNISPESSSLLFTGLESQFKSKVKYTKF